MGGKKINLLYTHTSYITLIQLNSYIKKNIVKEYIYMQKTKRKVNKWSFQIQNDSYLLGGGGRA